MEKIDKIFARAEETTTGIRLVFFQESDGLGRVEIETGVKQCLLQRGNCPEVVYSDSELLRPIGIICQVCAACQFKPGNKEGGCRAYYQEKK